ncbi:hypothetical protein MJH12_17085, partial [bacterium]|nr:hypothetical protein [bacterium]
MIHHGQFTQDLEIICSDQVSSQTELKAEFLSLFRKRKYTQLKALLNTGLHPKEYDQLILSERVLLRFVHSELDLKDMTNFHFFDPDKAEESIEKVVLLLVDRWHLKEALILLQNYLEIKPNHQVALALYEKYKSFYKNDYYYRYYGYFIMVLQAFTTGVVLSVSIYFVEQAVDSIVSFLYYILALWALIPVFYINVRMIMDRFKKLDHCYTEIYEEGILISHHGKYYFLSKTQDIYLYQDDNDYSFISLIRHLPFVPNFTYIRAYDLFSKEMKTLPL